MKYKVWNQGSEVLPSTKLVDFRGETWEFVSCTHPRKISVKDDNMTREFFAQVFDVLIEEIE